MKLSKKIFFTFAGILAFVGTVFAFSKHHHDAAEHADYIVHKMTKKLALQATQVEKLNTAKEVILQTHQTFNENKPNWHTDIKYLVSQDNLDRELIIKHINDKVLAVQTQAPIVVNAVADFYDSLDSEQQAKIRKKLEKHLKHKHSHH